MSDETLRWYMDCITQRGLLSETEEQHLSTAVRVLQDWEHTRDELSETLRRAPTEDEWSSAIGYTGCATRFSDEMSRLRGAKQTMITSNLRLVVLIARKYANRGVLLQDLIQEGTLGLIHAVEKFDPEYANRFVTYAQYWIHQRISRAVGTTSRSIRVPVHMSDTISRIKRVRYDFLRSEGRFPTDEELADAVGISKSKLDFALASSRTLLSLEAPIGDASKGDDAATLVDFLVDEGTGPDEHLEQHELRQLLRHSLRRVLTPRDVDIMTFLYALDGHGRRSPEDVALIFGCATEEIKRAESKALRRLRDHRQVRTLLREKTRDRLIL